jgi:hypothetical protein
VLLKEVDKQIYTLNELSAELDRQEKCGMDVAESRIRRQELLDFLQNLKTNYGGAAR